MMYETIGNFAKQFAFQPKIENGENFSPAGKFVVVGMGGSRLAADLLRAWNPSLNLTIHADYGLPPLAEDFSENGLIIANSYSGNTEEVLDAFEQAMNHRYPLAAVSVGGKLLELCRQNNIPFIQMPDTGIQPRMATGFNLKALLTLTNQEAGLKEVSELADSLDPGVYEETGRLLAEKLKDFVPVVYASAGNLAVAYNWKIKFNETGKIPAFYNVFPELNHNEMTGFDVQDPTRHLSKNFYFILLKDSGDHPRVRKRMAVLEKLYRDRKLPVEAVEIEGSTRFKKIFSSLMLADWTAYYTAKLYGVEPEQVPMVEEFKKLI